MTGELTGCRLENRGVIRITGPEARPLLQGLITNDIKKLSSDNPLYAALLTPQGKYLFDFIIFEDEDGLLLDCEKGRKPDLIQRLNFYKLRAKVEISDASDSLSVWAFAPPNPPQQALPNGWIERSIHYDPRHEGLGGRAVLKEPPKGITAWDFKAFEDLRLSLGIPDGSRDIEIDKRFILEANLDKLNGVDFKKGCYVGQEMTARMNYRGTLKKCLLPAKIEGPLPAPGTEFFANGKAAGHILSGQEDKAMTLTRLEFLEDAPFETGDGVKVTSFVPDWLGPIED